MLGRLGLKLLQSGWCETRKLNASPGLLKMLAPTMPILTPSTFPPAKPMPLKTGSLIGSWKLVVPMKIGSEARANGGASGVPAPPLPSSVKLAELEVK